MAEAATIEPTADHDGFSPEERAQFESMRETESATPEPSTPDPAPSAVPGPADAPAADKPPAAGAAAPGAAEAPTAGEEDDDDEAPPAPVPGAPIDPNAQRQPRRVAYGKFQRLEARYKELQTKFNEKDQITTRLDERLKLLNEALATPQTTQPAAEEDPEPDSEKDIFEYVKWQKRQIAKQGETIKSIQEGRQTATEETQIAQTYETDARQFVATEPNFIPAYEHLMGVRLAQLAMYYYGKDVSDPEAPALTAPEINRIRQIAAGEERQVVAEALANGQSPAKRIYQLARASGFRPQAAAAVNGAAKPTNGAAPPVNGKGNGAASNGNGAAAPAQPSVSDEIDRIKAGQDASLSLSGGGGVPNQPMTAERLANMPQAEFERWVEVTPPDLVKQIMGG